MKALAIFAGKHPELDQIELNPLLLYEKGIFAVDVRIFARGEKLGGEVGCVSRTIMRSGASGASPFPSRSLGTRGKMHSNNQIRWHRLPACANL